LIETQVLIKHKHKDSSIRGFIPGSH